MLKIPVKKRRAKQYPKMTPWGPPGDPKMGKNKKLKNKKAPKNSPKQVFWGVIFLMIFWVAKKVSEKLTPDIDNPDLPPQGSLGDYRGNNKKDNPICSFSNTPLS